MFFDTVIVCSVTGSTQAGMVAGFAAQERERRVIGIDGSAKPAETLEQVSRIARNTAALIEVGRDLRDDELILDDRYHAGTYGIPDEQTLEAIRTAARFEGMLTDPVYEGKSMAGMIDLVARGEIERGSNVLYAHLGGQPALSAYAGVVHVSLETERPSAVELAVLDGVQKRVLWLAAAIVHHANHVRPNRSGVKVGGHQASSASMVSLMTALWFAFLEAPDRVSVKPHASPVLHAINYLLGRLEPRYLETLRQFGGLQSYPSRAKDPDPVDYSTGSVGIGATAPIWGALAHRYVAGHFDVPVGGRQIALLGDAELDEGACWEAIADPMVAKPRRGHVGRRPQPPVARPRRARHRRGPPRVDVRGGGLALRDGQVRAEARRPRGAAPARRRDAQRGVPAAAARRRGRAAAAARGRRRRPRGRRAAAHVPRPRRPRPRRAARRLPPGRRRARPAVGRLRLHDQGLAAADRGPPRQPLGTAQREQYEQLAATLGADPEDPWAPFEDGSPEAELCASAARRLARPRAGARRASRAPVPDDLGREHKGTASTQQAFGRFFVDLVREAPEVAERVVTVSPDVGTSTNLGGWINKAGIWSVGDRIDWFADDTDTLVRWRETDHGRHIELGIAEVNLVGLLGELGATWSRDGQPLLPVGTIYDPFVARALEPWSFGIYAGGQSILVGTPSGVTLGPEGGAHQSVITPSIGIEQPGCTFWEPAFGQDLEWTFLHALSRLGREDGEAAYFRLSTRPIDQSLQNGTREEVLSGGYRLRPADDPRVVIAVMGALVPEAVEAADILREEAGAEAEVVCITSADLLYRSFQARAGLAEGDPATLERAVPPRRPGDHAARRPPAHAVVPRRRVPGGPALRPVGRSRRALRAPRDRRRVGGGGCARPDGLAGERLALREGVRGRRRPSGDGFAPYDGHNASRLTKRDGLRPYSGHKPSHLPDPCRTGGTLALLT